LSRFVLSKRIVLVNSASSAASIVLNLLLIVWLQQYLLRRVSPAEYSLLPIVMSVMAFAPLLTTVLSGGIGRYVTAAYARGDDAEVTSICSTMFPLLTLGGLMVLLGGGLGVWHVDRIITIAPERVTDARLMLALLVASAAVRLPCSVLGGGFVVRQRLLLQDLIDFGTQLLRLAVLFALLFGVSTRVIWVVVANVASEVAGLAIATPMSMRLVPSLRVRWRAIRWPLARELVGYGGWTVVHQAGETLRVAADPLMLNEFSTAFDVASFQVAGIAPRMLPMMVAPLTRPFIPILAALHATEDWGHLRSTLLRTSRYQTWVILSVGLPALIFGREFMVLYVGEQYATAGAVMSLLLLVPALGALNCLGPAALAAAGEVRPLAIRVLLARAGSLLLSVVFVVYLHGGALGSAAATALAAVTLDTTLIWPLAWRATHITIRSWLREVLLPTTLPAVPSLVLCLVVHHFIGIATWFELLAWSASSATLFAALVLAFALRSEDRRDLVLALQRVIPWATAQVRGPRPR